MLRLIKQAPNKPGIYLFYKKNRELVYVGKATNLRSRIKSYFAGQKSLRPIETFINEVKLVKWLKTDSGLEAIILEANYIKKFQPIYNVLGKDDKSWNYLVITKDIYPRLETIRAHELNSPTEVAGKGHPNPLFKAGVKKYAKIFGPYPGLNTKEALKLLRKLFNYSTCKPNCGAPCFYYQIQQCRGVCTGKITSKEYKHKVIQPLTNFLAGNKKQVITNIKKQMAQAAKTENYEEAARLRNQLFNLKKIQDIALLNKSFFQTNKPALNLKQTISRIEGYDVSNLGSTGKVGSLVSFVNGEPHKAGYKKFKIRTVAGQSDVACLAEILERRFHHPEWPLPDLILIDGGRPQINTAKKVLAHLKINLPIVSIAKGLKRKKNEFFVTDQAISGWANVNQTLLINVRDEAHRFAITYQKQLRKI